ncbi:MAG: NosD domain-containing protein [Thermoplasmata archaeon]
MRRPSAILIAWILSTLSLLSFISVDIDTSSGNTYVGGSISTDTNWTLEGSPYIVVGNIVVEDGVTLTIEAGVEVLFDGRYEILVYGTLRSLGKSDMNVVFMPNPPVTLWESIRVQTYGHLELRNSTILGAYEAVAIIGSENNVISGSYFGTTKITAFLGEGNRPSGNNLIASNTFQTSYIWLGVANNYTIRGNRFLGFSARIGASGHGHIIENNYLEGAGGILLSVSNTTIRGNVFFDNDFAVLLTFSENNEIYGNWIEKSRDYAICLNCTGCRVWNNSFIDNPLFDSSQAIDPYGLSYWNESYPIGGNYWSNYVGTDRFKGPNQDIPGSDGIGDTPYPIYDTTFDYYPLVNYTPKMPDIAVYDEEILFDPSGPIEEGESIDISAAVYNIGSEDATIVWARFFDGNPQDGVRIDGDQLIVLLPRGGWKEWVGVTWTAEGIGWHDICVFADPENTIQELNESNNQACASIEVLPPSALSPPTDLNAHLSGSEFQNVTVNWKLSIDDGKGSESVIGYDVYRNATSYDSKGRGYQLLERIPNGTSEYVDENAGEGDPINYFYCVCAVNAAINSSCSPNQAGKFTRSLSQGLNLISIPLIQSNASIEYVLQTVKHDKAWSYLSYDSDPWKSYMTFKPYKGDLPSINHTMGIWVNVTKESNLTVAGMVPAQTIMHLEEGWNLVGFPSMNSSYSISDLEASIGATRVEGFDPMAPPFFLRVLGDAEVLLVGEAYWVKVEAEIDWVVEMS